MEQLLNLTKKKPIHSWRTKGIEGILASKLSTIDPAFDIDGLPDPFSVFFPAFITNLYGETIYVTAVMVSPPVDWTDSEQDIVTISTGEHARVEKNNATRATPTAGTNETITVRWNYRIGSYAGTIIGYDEFSITIYWESILAGTIDDTDDFETDLDGWSKTDISGVTTFARSTLKVVHGTYSAMLTQLSTGLKCYIEKTFIMGAGTRAYLFGFILAYTQGVGLVSIESPVETLDLPKQGYRVWRRWGVRLNAGASNTVRIYQGSVWGNTQCWYDYLRWVRY